MEKQKYPFPWGSFFVYSGMVIATPFLTEAALDYFEIDPNINEMGWATDAVLPLALMMAVGWPDSLAWKAAERTRSPF
ncbi:MAG: hypothetical protein ACJKTH_01465 [Patescibacteria group bacterium UBA2163]